MKRTLAGIVLCFSSLIASAAIVPDWFLLAESEQGDRHYVDTKTLIWDENFNLHSTIKIEFKTPQHIGNQKKSSTFILTYSVKCAAMTATAIAQFAIVDNSREIVEATTQNKESSFDKKTLFDIICINVKYFEKFRQEEQQRKDEEYRQRPAPHFPRSPSGAVTT
jgi:hypothetical protein